MTILEKLINGIFGHIDQIRDNSKIEQAKKLAAKDNPELAKKIAESDDTMEELQDFIISKQGEGNGIEYLAKKMKELKDK